uniref:BRICHOS domain-containing protein n=1 Tax=Panagrellus redivivus TaxID=6233 RepID=A0A7E4W3C4_PANRE
MSQTTLVSMDSIDEKTQSKQTDNSSKCSLVTVILYILALSSSAGVLLLSKHLYFDLFSCPKAQAVFTGKINWDEATRLSFDEKNVTILRAVNKNRCYVIPRTSTPSHKLQLIREVISTADRHAILGEDGSRFCQREAVYLLDVVKESTRFRRNADSCKDVVLDCANGVIGEVRSCLADEKSKLVMERMCLSDTEVKVTLSKAPSTKKAMILLEKNTICDDRQTKGLSC